MAVSFGHERGGPWDIIPVRVRGSLVTTIMNFKFGVIMPWLMNFRGRKLGK